MTRPFINRAAAKAVSLVERVFICVSRLSGIVDPYWHNTARAVLVAAWSAFGPSTGPLELSQGSSRIAGPFHRTCKGEDYGRKVNS